MAYEATRTGAYQTAIKAADAVVTALINTDKVARDEAVNLHERIRRAVYEDIKVVVEKDIEDAKSRPQSSGGGGGRRSGGGGGGQSSIPTDGSTMFGKKDENGVVQGGGAVGGLTIAEVAKLSGSQMQDRGAGDGTKTGLAYLKGLTEWDDYKNDYMKRRIVAFLGAQNASAKPAEESAGAPTGEAPAGLDEDFTFPEGK